MDKSSLSMSLKELIASNCLSKSAFFFENEDKHSEGDQWSESRPSSPNGRNPLEILNSAKVSLLLAKSVVNYFNGDTTNKGYDATSLQLDNISVKLMCTSELQVLERTGGYRKREANSSPYPCEQSVEKMDDGTKPRGSGNNESDLPLDFISQFFDVCNADDEGNDVRHHINESSEQSLTANSPLEREYDIANTDITDCNPSSYHLSGIENFNTINSRNICKVHWTLLGVKITRPNNFSSSQKTLNESPEISELLPMQLLGILIYTVFSQNNVLRSPLTHQKSAPYGAKVTDCGYNNDVEISDSSKIRKSKESSLFCDLLETGHYPVSVCRLLSDMIDVGDSGKADSPFTTFDDVIQDLEQMSFHPRLFLYDPENGYYSSNILFGQRYYGRKAEVTKILEVSTRLETKNSVNQEGPLPSEGAEAVFISGIAGCGKTHLAQNVGDFLNSIGWIVLTAKFERCLEHGSREIVSSLFDTLVADLMAMKSGNNEADVEYSQLVIRAISGALDQKSLLSLAEFIPSIEKLIGDIDRSKVHSNVEMSHWQLGFLLSRLVCAVLSLERRMMIIFDDMQWCDSMTLALISEIIISVGRLQSGRQQFLLVGTYRDNEITHFHPFTAEYVVLQQSKSVNITEVKLSNLSKNDVTDIIMAEMRLPRRLVSEFADVVHKKSSGHALFVVELLNSLVRDSTLKYSPQKHRIEWDKEKISSLKTWDSVASFIVSNLSLLQPEALQSLRILSCIGMQTHLSLIYGLDGFPHSPEAGISSFVTSLVEVGILESTCSVIKFSHDLIQQQVYESMPLNQRRELHLEIGMWLGSKTLLKSSTFSTPIEADTEQMNLGQGENVEDSIISPCSFLVIATDQINHAGPEFVLDYDHRATFSYWNHLAGKEATRFCNFQSALHYYKKGIDFISGRTWNNNTFELCLELHEGAAFSLLAIGEGRDVPKYVNSIIENVPFEDSLVAHFLLIRSLETCGKNTEAVARGLAVLRALKFDIPSAPNPLVVINAMIQTGDIASRHNFNGSISLHRNGVLDARKRNVLKIIDAVNVACYRSASPHLPLVTCALVNYSLQNGIYEESASAFALFGYFKVFLEGNYEEGRHWGNVTLRILDKVQVQSVRAHLIVYAFVAFWFVPLEESARSLFQTYDNGIKVGDVDTAMYALCFGVWFSFFKGEKLTILLRSCNEFLTIMAKYSKESAKLMVNQMITIGRLTGQPIDPFPIFEGLICDVNNLVVFAMSSKNLQLLEATYVQKFFSHFWMDDYVEAEKWSKLAFSLPSSKMPKISYVYHTFLRGLLSFHMYRDGGGEYWLNEGEEMLCKMQLWLQNSTSVFDNKFLLLKAEYCASTCNVNEAKGTYLASIKSAQDHGHTHEQGLAYELMGRYLHSIVELTEASYCFKNAHECYMRWGALSKADRIRKDHRLDFPDNVSTEPSMVKHSRDW